MSAPMALLLLGGLLAATDPNASAPEAHVEASDRDSAAVLRDGYRRSPTLRTLVDSINASPWFVFVQEGACPTGSDTIGCLLHTVGRYHGAPYLRIRLVRGRTRDQIIATLAHELQHAWEAISDPSVVDNHSLSAMFRRIGYESLREGSTIVFETAEADRVGVVVMHELDADNVQRR